MSSHCPTIFLFRKPALFTCYYILYPAHAFRYRFIHLPFRHDAFHEAPRQVQAFMLGQC